MASCAAVGLAGDYSYPPRLPAPTQAVCPPLLTLHGVGRYVDAMTTVTFDTLQLVEKLKKRWYA